MIDEFAFPVVVNDRVELSVFSSRIDILVPVLNFKGDAEDLLLDMHYSLIRRRYWESGRVIVAVAFILKFIESGRDDALKELGFRVFEFSPEELIVSWLSDLERTREVALTCCEICFERRH
jgi:hypothetical protein